MKHIASIMTVTATLAAIAIYQPQGAAIGKTAPAMALCAERGTTLVAATSPLGKTSKSDDCECMQGNACVICPK